MHFSIGTVYILIPRVCHPAITLSLPPRACARGKALSVCRHHKNRQIWRSRRHSQMTCKYHYGVGNVGKLTFFCLLDALEGPHKSRVSIGHAFRPHPFMPCAAATAHARTRGRP